MTNTIQLTQAEFDALPEHHHSPEPVKAGTRWKRWSEGKWWLGEYIEVGAAHVIYMRMSQIEVKNDP